MSAISVSCLRRLLAWSLIAQQLLVGTGVSVPCLAAADRAAERYPCENCSCGCRSAEQCWRQCCCFTNLRKVAWAKWQGVAVPAFIVVAAEQEATTARDPSCPEWIWETTSTAAALSRSAPLGVDDEPKGADERRRSGISWLSSLRCHGSAELWQAAGASWPGDRPAAFRVTLLPLGRVEPWPVLKNLFSLPEPPTPPPKSL